MQRRVLIVDDNIINRKLLKNALCREYDILEAGDGREALQIIESCHDTISAILLDVIMPEIDGYEVLRRIRDNVTYSNIPVIMVTGTEEEESRATALSYGANDFILKPFNPEIVKHCLNNNITLYETTKTVNILKKDKLTGLWNREAFFQEAAAQIADKPEGYYILGCVDIDNFKIINDQYGSETGDRIIKSLANALLESCRKNGGICGRIFADWFVGLYHCVLSTSDSIGPDVLEAQVRRETGIDLTLSVGRYLVSDKSLSVSAMYDRASIAKSTIKGRYDVHIAMYDESMRKHIIYEQKIVNDMHTALIEGQFEVWFQPQYNHSTGALIGSEALVRWRHPGRGIIPPDEFIPVFERNGFIYEMDKFVWEQVCISLRSWLDRGLTPLPVSVNISRHDIFCHDLTSVLTGLLQKYNIPVEMLRLEITESAFSKSAEQIVNVVKQLVDYGFTVEIDDFGSGYSSLNILKDVPAQILKLDMKFLENSENMDRSGNIVESIVRMAKWLGMSVIAEGVETIKQADYLCSIGCCYLQGYLFARPMTTEQYEKLFGGAEKEERLLALETVENLDNNSFWNPDSIDTLIFNSYVGCACIFEYYNERIELLRVTEKYVNMISSTTMTIEDMLKLDWVKFLDEESKKRLSADFRASIVKKREITVEYTFLDLPGCQHETYQRSTLRIIASAGERYLVYCISENITAQRLVEQEIRETSAQLQTMMDDIPGGYCRLQVFPGRTIKIVFFNQGLCRLTGMTRDEIMKTCKDNVLSGVHPDDIAIVRNAVTQMLKNGVARSSRYRLKHKDEGYIWVKIFGRISQDKNGDTYLNFYYTDATEQVKEEERQKEFLDNMPYGASLFGFDGHKLTVIHMNRKYWELVNRHSIEHLQSDFLQAVHPEDREGISREICDAIENNRDAVCHIRVLYGENKYMLFRVTGNIVRQKDGKYLIYASYTPILDETVGGNRG